MERNSNWNNILQNFRDLKNNIYLLYDDKFKLPIHKIMKYIVIIFVFVFILSFWYFYPKLIFFIEPNIPNEWEKKGQFGDIFGGLNALFSGLALYGVIISLILSSRERKYKQFEEHFFQQISIIQNIINELHLLKGDEICLYKDKDNNDKLIIVDDNYRGRLVFRKLRNEFKLEQIPKHKYGNIGKYEDFYKNFLHRILGNYYRSVFSVIKYIDRTDFLSKKEKIFYVHLLRAQISSDELFFLFYNGLSKWGKEKAKPIMEKYSFFEHLHYELSSTDLISYKIEAYGTNDELQEEYKKQKENQENLKNNKCTKKFKEYSANEYPAKFKE